LGIIRNFAKNARQRSLQAKYFIQNMQQDISQLNSMVSSKDKEIKAMQQESENLKVLSKHFFDSRSTNHPILLAVIEESHC
jgi:hypothetical protein